ncbi:MAG: hypothetical protein NT045_08225 [Candidatus Aureabacteria bacterium]|nr:hypothetical protein [Candidatus Auribacterota bacterium]
MKTLRAYYRYYPAYILFRSLCGILRALPEPIVAKFVAIIAEIGYLTAVSHRRMAMANLDIAFGGLKTRREKRAIVRGAFRSVLFTYTELIRIPQTVHEINRRNAIVTDTAPIRDALDHGRGVIFIITHFGNWELLAHRGLVVCDGRVVSVARPINNPLIYQEIERLRCINGAVLLRKKWVVREIIEMLKHNWCVSVLMDQYAGRFAPFVPFFGCLVSTTPAAAVLAMRTGAAVIPVFNVRQRFGYHRMNICEEVPMVRTGDKEADIVENCTRINRVIEAWVRRHPDQWLWMARRWRRKKGPEEP